MKALIIIPTYLEVENVDEVVGQVEILILPAKGGLGAAYRAGFRHGFSHGYDVVVQMDADFSHDPAALPELLSKIEAGADVAIGSRYVAGGNIPNWPTTRRVLSRVGNFYASTVLGLKVRDATSRLRAEIVEVPITFNDRVRGVSKMSWHIIGEAMSLVTWWGIRDRVVRRRPSRLDAPNSADAQSATAPIGEPEAADAPTPEPVVGRG